MSLDPDDDGLVRLLSTLPVSAPDEMQSAHVRARCHDVIARRARGARQAPRAGKLLIALGALYAVELMRLVVVFLSGTLSTLKHPDAP